jgi:hypothetical protein
MSRLGTLVPKAYVLKANGTRQELTSRPTLPEAQKLVGGYVEKLPVWLCRVPRLTAFGNEDGRPMHLPLNQKATDLLGYTVVGDIIIMEGWRSLA